ncbi:putative glycoside hydrolase [Paenibacillus contaminans]|uniref:GTP-binding protein n=1 Tax=Paenibacillus contaminans TaxID=450362 RepID=A0A329MBI6_9BACL|nr:putative glycoside hydrolase [Paenibacillus contaminans]RAV17300.1 GTP-binding protein [Paenibacillus contaminans]
MNGERICTLFYGLLICCIVLLGTACSQNVSSRHIDGYTSDEAKAKAPEGTDHVPVQEQNRSDFTKEDKAPADTDIKSGNERRTGNEPSSPAVPIPSGGNQSKEEVKAKGIYVSGRMAASGSFQQLLDLVDRTDLNAMVIDMKNDSGQFIFPSSIPLAEQIGATESPMIPSPEAWMQRLKARNIYSIARIVAFKDPYLAVQRPDFAMRTKDGNAWQDARGVLWIDPYNEEVWDYNIAIAKEAARIGFDEIQFDYVRFPENGQKVDREVQYQNPHGWSKAKAIEAFLSKVKEGLKGTDVFVSADVFGLTTSSSTDMGIGQEWSKIAKHVDVISPMIYPSHYGKGVYGIANPDQEPYLTVRQAVSDALAKNDEVFRLNGKSPAIRPWFQAFTATWLPSHQRYGAAAIKEQILAAKELGLEQFMLWNPACKYAYE